MHMKLKSEADGFGKGKVIRKMLTTAAVLGLSFSLAKGTVSANEERGEDGRSSIYESRIYGTIEKTPPGNIGAWVINKRDVTVTRETRIIEKHGKAVAGAYVEVEGNNTGKTFTASKIEVKRSKHK